MLSKKLADDIYIKLVLRGVTKKQLATDLNVSYNYLVNVLNRKASSKSLEIKLKNWSER